VISLLDVDVLVALAWPNHAHHEAAHRRFDRHQRQGWATSSSTQTGFVRVSSNAGVLPDARSPREAIGLLREMVALPHHELWSNILSWPAHQRAGRSPVSLSAPDPAPVCPLAPCRPVYWVPQSHAGARRRWRRPALLPPAARDPWLTPC
jgi:hypothetical protein